MLWPGYRTGGHREARLRVSRAVSGILPTCFTGCFRYLAKKNPGRPKKQRVSLDQHWLALVKGVRGNEYSYS